MTRAQDRPFSRPRCGGRRVATLAAALTVLAAACGGSGSPAAAPEAPRRLQGFVPAAPVSVAAATLPETTAEGSRPFRFVAAPGRLLAVYFGYLSCPDICPTTMADLGNAVGRLSPADRRRVDVAFVTVDIERDTGEEVREYLEHFFRRGIHPVRPDDWAQLEAVMTDFGVQAEVQTAADGEIEVGHSALTSIVDDQGRVRVQWPFGFSARTMRQDLELMLGDGG